MERQRKVDIALSQGPDPEHIEVVHLALEALQVETMENAATAALKIAADGRYMSKTEVVDQMIRALLHCPIVDKTHVDSKGEPYTLPSYGSNEAYQRFAMATGWNTKGYPDI